MKILVIGMPFSIHTARWVSLVNDQGWEIHFFSSYEYAKPIDELERVNYHDYFYNIDKRINTKLKYRSFSDKKIYFPENLLFKKWAGKAFRFLSLQRGYQDNLENLINKIKPDIIHSMESQHAGYMVSEFYLKYEKKHIKKPIWVHTTYGIDIDYFKHFSGHRKLFKKMFQNINLYLAEGERDVNYAKQFGYKGRALIFPSVAGGYDLSILNKYKWVLPSKRKTIVIKGYQNSMRRALVALRAIHRCKDVLNGYRVLVYSCSQNVVEYINYINNDEAINIEVLEHKTNEGMMKVFSEARVSISNNLSDGNPNSLLESMLMGAFPIQSVSIASKFIQNGVNGFLVHPEDVEIIELRIREALFNNELVDSAAVINQKIIKEELDILKIKPNAIKLYHEVLGKNID